MYYTQKKNTKNKKNEPCIYHERSLCICERAPSHDIWVPHTHMLWVGGSPHILGALSMTRGSHVTGHSFGALFVTRGSNLGLFLLLVFSPGNSELPPHIWLCGCIGVLHRCAPGVRGRTKKYTKKKEPCIHERTLGFCKRALGHSVWVCVAAQVYANADTPEDAAEARRNGATGIGLVRTEHMFYSSEERLTAVCVAVSCSVLQCVAVCCSSVYKAHVSLI